MQETTSGFSVRETDPGVAVIDVRGDITPASEQALMGAYGETNGASAIVLNFSDLDYMNSGGIGLLVTLLVRAQRQKQQLLAFGLSDHYRQIFELTRLDDVISIHRDEAAALTAVTR